MIKYVEFRGFVEDGVKDYGRIILEKGKGHFYVVLGQRIELKRGRESGKKRQLLGIGLEEK